MVELTINNKLVGLRATRKMTCPAGTAYWTISAHLGKTSIHDTGPDTTAWSTEAIWTYSTGAIYGPPDLRPYADDPDLAAAVDRFSFTRNP